MPISLLNSFQLIISICSIKNLTRPNRHFKRATLESPFGPFCKAIWAENFPLGGLGVVVDLGN